MNRVHVFAFILAVAIVATMGGYAFFFAADGGLPLRSSSAWHEVKWPFPVEPWGPGRAFHCDASHCGTEVDLYIRAKLGFCNCETGVVDDDHLDRIGDLDLVGGSDALGPGRQIAVHWMKGRSRSYSAVRNGPIPKSVLSIAFNDRCDVIVATSSVASVEPAAQEAAVLQFLNSDLVLRWAEQTLGL